MSLSLPQRVHSAVVCHLPVMSLRPVPVAPAEPPQPYDLHA